VKIYNCRIDGSGYEVARVKLAFALRLGTMERKK
jgi:hypothetical protein